MWFMAAGIQNDVACGAEVRTYVVHGRLPLYIVYNSSANLIIQKR